MDKKHVKKLTDTEYEDYVKKMIEKDDAQKS